MKKKRSKFSKTPLNQPTSEELFIANYLDDNNIKYKSEYLLHNLKGDVKTHRRADFYLKNLGIYVEYFGLYNSTKTKREEYDKKAEVYISNGLPTVFLYPHELGFLDYAFDSKIKKLFALDKFRNKKKEYRYLLNRYFKKGKPFSILIAFVFYNLYIIFENFEVGLSPFLGYLATYSCLVLTLYFTVRFCFDLPKHFVK